MANTIAGPLEAVHDEAKIEAVLRAVEDFDLTSSSAWQELDSLSTHTEFDEIDARTDGIFLRHDGAVEIVAAAYVTLTYGGKNDATSLADSYPTKIIGHFDQTNFIIDDVAVDTTSFFE